MSPTRAGAADVSFVADGAAVIDGVGLMGRDDHTPEETADLGTLASQTNAWPRCCSRGLPRRTETRYQRYLWSRTSVLLPSRPPVNREAEDSMRFGIRASALAAAVSVALAAAGAIAVAKSKIDAKRSPNVDFSPIKTYIWLPSPPLTLQAAPGTMRDPKVIQAEVEPWIIGTADSELSAHGWKRVTAPPADVQIIYYLSHGTGFNASNIGDYYQAVTGYALIVPPYLAPTQSVVVYEEGTIVIDIVQDRNAIWRGTATTTINRELNDAKRKKSVEDLVRKLIDRVPKK